MRKIKINISLEPIKNKDLVKSYKPDTYKQEFLEDSGILLSDNRKICPKEFTPYMDGKIVDEDKFSKYVSDHSYLNYEIVVLYMFTNKHFYCIEFEAGYVDHVTEKTSYLWNELHDPFGKEYRFQDEQTAIHKAIAIAKEGRWGCPIKLRVMKRIIKNESWHIYEIDPKKYYQK